jgi:hypothetical protein
MARLSVLGSILERLEPYLAGAVEAYKRDGTLRVALNPAGGINVSRLSEACGLPPTARQHLYKPEVVRIINAACHELGVEGIGTEADLDRADKAVRQRLAVTAARAKSDAQAAVESKAEVRGLLERIAALTRERHDLLLRVASLEEQLAMVRQGLLPRV